MGSYSISFTRPESMTTVMSSIVMDVSATLVLRTILRTPDGMRRNTRDCARTHTFPTSNNAHAQQM
jgi:hypothetical protein